MKNGNLRIEALRNEGLRNEGLISAFSMKDSYLKDEWD